MDNIDLLPDEEWIHGWVVIDNAPGDANDSRELYLQSENAYSAVGSLEGGGDLGNVDLIYVPEPSTVALIGLGLLAILPFLKRPGSSDKS